MKLRMYVISAVFKRNFLSYFSGVIGYLFIVAFVGLGSFLAFTPQFFADNLANLDQLNKVFPQLLLFIIPAITMGAWADERKLGTDELLFTLPASDLEILIGKYLGVLGVYTVALLFSLSHVIVLRTLGDLDVGLMFTTYLGYWLSGAALLSAGMLASILTSSATVAYVLGAIICAIPVYIDVIAPNNRLLQGLSVGEQLRDFGLGMIPLGGLLYFASLTILMLYLNLVLISRRHWAGGPQRAPMGLHYFVRGVCVAVILVGLNVVAANANTRLDLTAGHLYSLSPTTRAVISEIKPDSRILIQAFISPEVPRDFVPVRSTLIGLLRQYDQIGGDRVVVRIVDTRRYTDAADEAMRFGIQPQEIQSERGGRYVQEDVFLGVVVTGGVDDEVVIPFFDVGTPIEYELTRSLRTVAKAKRLKLGVLATDAKLFGGFDMATMRNSPEWRIVTELKKQYDVKEVQPQELSKGGFDVLVAAMPSSLTAPDLAQLVDYVKNGGATLLIDDPFPMFHSNLAPKSPKPAAGGMGGMFGQQPPGPPKADGGTARPLTDALHIAWDNGRTVWDTYDPHPEFSEAFRNFDVVYIGAKSGAHPAFSEKSPITRGMQELMLFYPGTIQPREGSPYEFIPLLRSSPKSTTLEWNEYITTSPFGGTQPIPSPDPGDPMLAAEHVIAAQIIGKSSAPAATAKLSGAGINVVYLLDLDMISNEFFFVRDKQWQGLKLDNVTFVLNAVDQLSGDTTFIELRNRRDKHRTLTSVENETAKFRMSQLENTRAADAAAKQQLEEARGRLAEERKRIEADKSMDDRTKRIRLLASQENERRALEVREATIQNEKNTKIREGKDQSERAIRAIEEQKRRLAIFIPPIPALLLGMFVFAIRVRDERQGVVPDRMVAKHRN